MSALDGKLAGIELLDHDVVDVVGSKLKRFSANDQADIDAMIQHGLVPHHALLDRFRSAVDVFACDARAEDLPKYVEHLHRVERDLLDVEETAIELPSLFWTADRLLRETVKALLGAEVLLCARLEDVKAAASCLRALQQEIEARAAADPVPTEHSPDGDHIVPVTGSTSAEEDAAAGQSRDLATLLAKLKCDAANKVQLENVIGQRSATLECAIESARAARDQWGATFGPCSILINREEKDTLEAAGAEFPLMELWNRCE